MATNGIDAVVFDAYGTLFDVFSVQGRCEQECPGKGSDLSQLWRTKQLEYTWLRSLMGRYENFEDITRAALRVAARRLNLPLDAPATERLMAEYLQLTPFPDVKDALTRLAHLRLCILSNGTPRLLDAVVRNAGLTHTFAQVISVDSLRIYKPHPSVYQYGVDLLGLPKERIAFISSNFWDVSGASAFGFRTYWINRAGAHPDELGFAPVAVLSSLGDLVTALARQDVRS